MAYTIEISGSDVTSLLKAESLDVTKGADNRNSCSLSLITTASAIGTTDGSYIGQDLKIEDGGNVIFGGVIKTVGMKKMEPGVGNTVKIQVDISSNGYSDIPSRRTISQDYAGQYAGAIVANILANALDMTGANEHITSGTITSGAYITSYSASYKSVKDIFDELAEASGFKWYIDDNKALNFLEEDAITAAAHDIVEGGAFKDYSIDSIEISLENYRNKQFVTGKAGVAVTVSDATEIAARQAAEGSSYSSGVYGNVIEESSIDNEDDATTAANNALKRYGAIPYSLTFSSFTNDWVAGTQLKVNLPTFGISSDAYYLIESVNIVDADGVNLQSTVTATRRKTDEFSTQRTENYFDYFRKLASSSRTSSDLRRTETAAIDKTAGTISVLAEGATAADTIAFTETATSMTFTWTDGFSTTVSIS